MSFAELRCSHREEDSSVDTPVETTTNIQIWHILLHFQWTCLHFRRRQQSLTSAGALNPASQKTASRKLYENLLRRYCPRNRGICFIVAASELGLTKERPTSEATSLTRAAVSRKFLAVLLSPERFSLVPFFCRNKRKYNKKDLGFAQVSKGT